MIQNGKRLVTHIRNLDDALWQKARLAALKNHQHIGAWLNEAMAEKLKKDRSKR